MDARTLLDRLRKRGIILQAAGDRLRFRPRYAVSPEEREALRIHKQDLLAILTDRPGVRPTPAAAEPAVVCDPELAAALSILEREIWTGNIGTTPLMVRGQPLGHLLPLDELARILQQRARGMAGDAK